MVTRNTPGLIYRPLGYAVHGYFTGFIFSHQGNDTADDNTTRIAENYTNTGFNQTKRCW